MQGLFWEMARTLFAHQDDLEWSDMYRYAVAIGADIERLTRTCGYTRRRCCAA